MNNTEYYAMEGGTMDYLYRRVLRALVMYGRHVAPRDQPTMELTGVTLKLWDARANLLYSPLRRLNYSFGVAEFLWMLTGRNDVETIRAFNSQIAQYAEDDYFRGAYGPKLVDQFGYVLDTLKKDAQSRQALLSLWRERPGSSKDIPCTVVMQFLVRDDALDLIVFMRSNDAFLGLPYDLYNFTMIQNFVAAQLDLEPGRYTHHVGSLHLYEKHWDLAGRISREEYDPNAPLISPLLPTGRVPLFVERQLLEFASMGAMHRPTLSQAEYVNVCINAAFGKANAYGDLLRVVGVRKIPQLAGMTNDPWRTLFERLLKDKITPAPVED